MLYFVVSVGVLGAEFKLIMGSNFSSEAVSYTAYL